MHRTSLEEVIQRLKDYQHWIVDREYPTSTRTPTLQPLERRELTDWLLNRQGLVMPLTMPLNVPMRP
jgi:hypothetical protein